MPGRIELSSDRWVVVPLSDQICPEAREAVRRRLWLLQAGSAPGGCGLK